MSDKTADRRIDATTDQYDADAVSETVKNVLLDGMGENNAAMNDPARDSSALRHAHNHMAEAYVLLNGGKD